ncbi:calcium-activated chloride channel regulator 1-like protein [Leptotrombidium deliense]|uniref:Calcium-activated chloride channel regulator 1-like protein n=1 Tax=Leptotrombidium deliense TaxID=299467 RepID=A0A443STQ3_9ACAR|nr:calcium-activated chloride channel regulator 1-like protein [Leptotrombidium deliense]
MADLFYTATERKGVIENVYLLVPKSWNLRSVGKDYPPIRKNKVFNNVPTTIQFAGCGKPGLRIDLSQAFLLHTDNTDNFGETTLSTRRKARSLLRQWMHYRYGVFDEHGFVGDAIYPSHYAIPGTTEIKITSCVSRGDTPAVQPLIINLDNNNNSCKLKVNELTGFPDHTTHNDCMPMIDFNANEDLVTSFMYEPRLESVTRFCNRKTHNSEAPNKQNLLCEGKSVWEVLEKHSDLRNEVQRKETVFTIIEMNAPRIAIMLDALTDRVPVIKSSTKKFLNGLPEGKEMIFLEYRNSTFTDMWTGTAFNYAGRDVLHSGICLYCGAKKVMDEIDKKQNEDSTLSGSQLILVTEGHITDNDKSLRNIVDRINQLRIKLKVIIYPFAGSDYTKLESLVSDVNGELITIPEHGEGERIKTTTLAKLYDTFDSINEWNENKPLLLNKGTFSTHSGGNFSFSVDQSLVDSNSDLYVYILRAEDVKSKNFEHSVKLVTKNEVYSFRALQEYHDIVNERGRLFTVNNTALKDKVGEMTLSLTVDHSPTPPTDKFFVAAYAQPRVRTRAITAECWVSGVSDAYILYAFVHKDYNEFVRDAKVTMIIEDDIGTTQETVLMYDDGYGDPDITKGDGIYSQYITNIKFGKRYTASVELHSKADTTVISGPVPSSQQCCGSSIPLPVSNNVAQLQRRIECGSFLVKRNSNSNETPRTMGAINSLRVMTVEKNQSRKLEVSFRRPFGSGVNSKTEFKFFRENDYAYIRSEFDKRGKILYSWNGAEADKYGDLATAIAEVPFKESGRYYLAIRTSRLDAPYTYYISNIVSVVVSADPSIITEGNTESSSVPDSYVTDTYSDSLNVARLQSWQVIAVVSGSLVVIVLTLLLILCFVWSAKRRRDDQRSKPPKISTPVLTVDSKSAFTNKASNDMINVSGKQPLTDNEAPLPELSNTIISPVQSWSAGVLLGHYDRVQQAKERREPPPVMRMEDIPDNMSSVSNNSKFQGSTSDEDNVGNNVTWQQYDQFDMRSPIAHCQTVQYYPNDWRQSYNGRSQTPSDYDQRYGIPDQRKGSSAVSQV